MSNKYSQKFLDSTKKCSRDAIKIASKRGIQKTAESTRSLIGNKIEDKIASVWRNLSKKLHSKNNSEIQIKLIVKY